MRLCLHPLSNACAADGSWPSRLSAAAAFLAGPGKGRPEAGEQHWPESLHETDPEARSGNPLLQRFPEPSRRRARRSLPWKVLLVILLVFGAVFAADRLLPAFPDPGDPAVWQRALQWVATQQSPPAAAGAMADLKAIIMEIEPGTAGGARSALMALYALGALNVGNGQDWIAVGRILETNFPGSAFISLVQDVKLQPSVRVACPKCKGSGTCPTCGGAGQHTAQGLERGSNRYRREIGTSLGQSLSAGECQACKGSGKCRECGGSKQVDSVLRYPKPDASDMQERWAMAHKAAKRAVKIGYGRSLLIHSVNAIRQRLPGCRGRAAASAEVVHENPLPSSFPAVATAPESDRKPMSGDVSDDRPNKAGASEFTTTVADRVGLYGREMEKIEAIFEARRTVWAKNAVDELRGVQTRLREAGDLSGWEQVEGEISRFEKEQDREEPLPPALLPQLTEMRVARRKALLTLKLERTKAILSAAKSQRQEFEELTRRLTRENRIDEAREARAFLEKIEATLNDEQFGETVLASGIMQLDLARGPAQQQESRKLDVEQLEKLRSIYEREAAAVEKGYVDNVASWGSSYAAALEQLKAAMQNGGDLEGWEAVDRELKQFLKAGDIREALSAAPAVLTAERERYQKLREDYPRERQQKLATLAGLYAKHLGELQRAYVRDGRIEQARAVREELARVAAPGAAKAGGVGGGE